MKLEDMVNPFIEKTVNTFETMIGVKPVSGNISVGENGDVVSDVTGTIGITGDISGTISIRFPESLACKVASMFIGEDISSVNNDVLDTVGELANIIAGGAKGVFGQKGVDFKLSIPTAVQGDRHILGHPSGSSVIFVPFEMDSGKFYLELCLKEDEKQ